VQIEYIDTQPALNNLCEALNQSALLAVDTEFVRTRTLFPKLGLLQVNDGKSIALIDPIAVEDLTPFWQILSNENICKVLHACSEDLEVFLNNTDEKPQNIVDTQIMMSFLGHGLSMGYAAMIKHFTDIELDKSESRTDWTKRPLTEKQLTYAAADVDHLFNVFPKIQQAIEASGWLVAAQQETQRLIDKKYTPVDDETLYKQIKFAWKLNPKQLNLLKALAQWRYQQAKKRDLPIGFIAKDHTLVGVAKFNPKSINAMLQIEGVEMLDVKHKGKAMLTVLKHAEELSEQQYPDKIIRLDDYPGYKQAFKKVKNLVAKTSASSGQSPENLASKKQINQFLSWHYKHASAAEKALNVDVLQGWRADLMGEALNQLSKANFQ